MIRDVMKASLKKRDEERMKNSVEKLVDELKKTVEEGNDEQKDEKVKEEDQNQTAKEAEVPTIKVITKPESSEVLNKNVE
ncbi:hypothetical protein Hanom_Chr17g01590251 [Helianthus anomalus]